MKRDAEFANPEPFDMALVEYYSPKPNWTRYRKLIELGSKAGDPLAQYAMATWYLHGEPNLRIREDSRRAVSLLRKAALSFNRAMYDLAVCTMSGVGTRRDPERAYGLMSTSARLGSIPAMYTQAEWLQVGFGTTRNRRKAQEVLRRAKALSKAMRGSLHGSRED